MIDILFLTHNRLDFTRASLAALIANTNWLQVHRLVIFDDVSTDGSYEYLREFVRAGGASSWVNTHFDSLLLGGPVSAMIRYLDKPGGASLVAKIDNDVIVPPDWLDACLGVMEAHPHLDLLGIEPPASRTRAPWATQPSRAPELIGQHSGYAPCDSIGGIGLMRTRAFRDREPMRPHGQNGVGGFTDWQLQHRDVRKGWIVPPLDLFLLDRLPMEPWASLSREYIAKGWQRPWTNYRMEDRALWAWWEKERAA